MSAAPRQVVVGYDGSDRARMALDAARQVAAPGARVKVVYAHRVPPELTYYEFFQDVLAELERGARFGRRIAPSNKESRRFRRLSE